MSQNDAVSGLSPQQVKAIAHLLQGISHEEAAKACKTSRSTLRRWLAECPEFRQAIDWGKQELYQQTVLQLLGASTQAIATLVEVCQDKQQSGSARVSAAKSILELAVRGTLADDLNHALVVLRRYGFDVVDRRESDGISDS